MTEACIMGFLHTTGDTLKILHLGQTGLSFSDIGSLTSIFPVLEELFIARCDNLKKEGTMEFLSKTGKTLKILDL